jgi:hypothetical protein
MFINIRTSIKNRKIRGRRQFPKYVMVWGGICSTGKTPLVFVERNVKINAETYQNLTLKGTMVPWARQHCGRRIWTFQQDWAPSHRAKSTIDLCRQLFPRIWTRDDWPSYSPDLNAMDFAVWGILEEKISRKSGKFK